MSEPLSVSEIILQVLAVLVAAKVAAEVAQRAGVPALVGEIVAGIVIGPSLLGWVGEGPVLQVLAELGILLLLLEVGLQLDVGQLTAVGRPAMAVAVAGMVLPLAAGWAAVRGLGYSGDAAVFLGAALTATSIGVSARVFAELRAISGVEARTVLAAAVADDVLGLVLLTVVVRLVREGSVSAGAVAGVLALAIAFLVVVGTAGIRLARPVFGAVERLARSPGTPVALAFAFTLALAALAEAARLAPIVGAFVAGLALARSDQAEQMRRELAPLGHLLVPVFFLRVGVDVELRQFADVGVVGLATVLILVGVSGKLAAAWAAPRSGGDRLLVGLGMVPRGEVGLIFAGLGLREGVLDASLYGALLLAVLATTLVPPPLLRRRLLQLQAREERVPVPNALGLVLEAAAAAAERVPEAEELERLARLGDAALEWDEPATRAFLRVLEVGNTRSWRLLEATGVIERALPELAAALGRRRADPFELDPQFLLRWRLVDRLRELDLRRLRHPEWLLLAGLLAEATDGDAAAARAVVRRMGLSQEAEEEVALVVGDHGLLRATAARPDGLSQEAVVGLAERLARPERARALYLVSLALSDADPEERARLEVLHERVQAVLEAAEGFPVSADEQREAARRLLGARAAAARRLAGAPRAYLLDHEPETVARHAVLVEGLSHGVVAVSAVALDHNRWRVEVAHRRGDQPLVAVTAALADAGASVISAEVVTWLDGSVVESLMAEGPVPSEEKLVGEMLRVLSAPPTAASLAGVTLRFVEDGSPWYTTVVVQAPDRTGLLRDLAAAFAACGVRIRGARASLADGTALDRFEVTDANGQPLDVTTRAVLRQAIEGGAGDEAGTKP